MKKQTKTYFGPYELTDWLCEQGRFGMKTPDPAIKADGRGIFIHRGRDKAVDPEVVAKMEEVRKAKGVVPRNVSDEEICERRDGTGARRSSLPSLLPGLPLISCNFQTELHLFSSVCTHFEHVTTLLQFQKVYFIGGSTVCLASSAIIHRVPSSKYSQSTSDKAWKRSLIEATQGFRLRLKPCSERRKA